jgi:predicted GTPase
MIMSTVEMRGKVHQIIGEVGPTLLEAIHAMLETYQKRREDDPVVGYELDGTPITASTLEQQADDAIEQVARGEYITLEELEKESEEWLKRTK